VQRFKLQDETARNVAAQVVQNIEPGTPLPDAHRSAGVEARQHYMLARELFHRRTQDWRPQARQALERALALEPGFARALADDPRPGLGAAVRHGLRWRPARLTLPPQQPPRS